MARLFWLTNGSRRPAGWGEQPMVTRFRLRNNDGAPAMPGVADVLF